MKKRIYHDEVLKLGLVPWSSWKTTKRKIENENFPAYYDGGEWSFDPKEIENWFKQRKYIPKAS